MEPLCPAVANLEVASQMDELLRARASAQRDIVITILGPTTGKNHVRMGATGQLMLRNMVMSLKRHGVTNYLAITTHLSLPHEAENNLCLSVLRPAGICCGYSGQGMGDVHAGANGRKWLGEQGETHPYMLFLQRWWFTGQVVGRGYNVLSIDTDMRLEVNPLELVRRVRRCR